MSDQPESRDSDVERTWRFSLAHLLLLVLAVALLAGAARMYLFAAISPRGILIAGIMGVVGVTVGRVVGDAGSRVPKVVLFIVCLLFYAGLAGGQIAPGEPYTMWAFLCVTGAMMLGILSVTDLGV